ncbi:hypothetical protein BJY00DRAFT_310398 [Aspergillus carlsbadensis]|nr:hypothetical protein BJY00DRAFT_310398 [Aspergillus carlsbadensis]
MTVNPGRCSNYTGASPPTGLTDSQYFCYIPIYQHWNTTNDSDPDPLAVLRGCCENPSENVGLYGRDNCEAYCNATEDTFGNLETCLRQSRELREFGCESAAVGRGAVSVGVWLVVALVVGGVLGA